MIKRIPYFLATLFFTLAAISPFVLKTKNIECKAQDSHCPAHIVGKLSKYNQIQLIKARNETIKTLSKEKSLEKYEVKIILPDTLLVTITEKDVDFYIVREGDDKKIAIGEDGQIIEEGNLTNTVQITLSQSATPNDDEIIFAANLIKELQKNFNISQLIVDTSTIKAKDSSGVEILLPLQGDIDVLLGSVKLILSWLKTSKEHSRIDTIDLRYKNPVLR